MGKEETYKDRLEQEGRDEDLFAPKKREPRGFVLHERRPQAEDETSTDEASERQPEGSGDRSGEQDSTRKAA